MLTIQNIIIRIVWHTFDCFETKDSCWSWSLDYIIRDVFKSVQTKFPVLWCCITIDIEDVTFCFITTKQLCLFPAVKGKYCTHSIYSRITAFDEISLYIHVFFLTQNQRCLMTLQYSQLFVNERSISTYINRKLHTVLKKSAHFK